MPLDPTTLTGELESLDSEVAVLQQRRRLVAELLVAEPITRAPFDPQATREAAAAIAQPDNGKGRWQPEVRPRPEPAATPAPKYGPEVALAMIEGAA